MSDVFVHKPFGELPKTWDYQAVESFVEYLTGPAFDSAKFNEKKLGVRLLRGINLTKGATRWNENNTKYWNANLPNYEKYLLSEGDIVVGMDGSLVGKNYAFMQNHDLPSLLVQRVARLRTLDTIDAKYLFYIFASDEWLKYVELVKTNSGIPHISNSDIKSLRIPYPPVIEQKKIASILTSVDEVIENTQKQIEKLQDVKKATMNELLTKGIGHTEFKDSELGRIPKSWEVKELGTVTNFSQGVQVDLKFQSEEKIEDAVRFVRISDYTKESETPRYIDKSFATKGLVSSSDIVMIRYGEAGRLCRGIVGAIANNLFTIRPTNILRNDYLFEYLRADNASNKVRELAASSTMPAISFSSLSKVEIKIPPLCEQSMIAAKMKGFETHINSLRQKLSQIKALKKSLMQDLLTGKVRVQVH